VINLPGSRDKCGEVLAATFSELTEFVRDNVISVSKVTEEEPLRELLLPRNATTRLCFFSLPLELLPFYRQFIFPVVEQAGFVPVTANDVISPGDNVSAKLDALIDRASVMITELTSSWTMAEYRMAIAKLKNVRGSESKALHPPSRKPFRLIVVVANSDQVPVSVREVQVLQRPNVITGDPSGFIADLAGTLRSIAEEAGLERGGGTSQTLCGGGVSRCGHLCADALGI
jgi:hypothetical protein